MSHSIPVYDPDSGERLGDVEVCDAHGEAGCLTFGPCAEPELRGYDGFGAPIYDHQEDDMPTDLPDHFKGTGKPKDGRDFVAPPADDSKSGFEGCVAIVFGLILGACLLFALCGALCWSGLWFFTHLPGF